MLYKNLDQIFEIDQKNSYIGWIVEFLVSLSEVFADFSESIIALVASFYLKHLCTCEIVARINKLYSTHTYFMYNPINYQEFQNYYV